MYKVHIAKRIYYNQVRTIAKYYRDTFLVSDIYFPVINILENIHLFLSNVSYEIVDDDYFKNNEKAKTDFNNDGSIIIKISNSVYEGACQNNGTDRFTITHEISHVLLITEYGFPEAKWCEDGSYIYISKYTDPEWQADLLAAELLIPYEETLGKDVEFIMKECQVSYSAALLRTHY